MLHLASEQRVVRGDAQSRRRRSLCRASATAHAAAHAATQRHGTAATAADETKRRAAIATRCQLLPLLLLLLHLPRKLSRRLFLLPLLHGRGLRGLREQALPCTQPRVAHLSEALGMHRHGRFHLAVRRASRLRFGG